MKDHCPRAFISPVLNLQQQFLFIYEKELLVVVFTQKWRHYLLHSQFIIQPNIDHTLSAKMLVKLIEFDFSIKFK